MKTKNNAFFKFIMTVTYAILLTFLVAILIASVKVGVGLIQHAQDIMSGLFFAGIIVGVTAGCMYFMQFFISDLERIWR